MIANAIGGNSGTFASPFYNSDQSAKFTNGSWWFDCWASPGCTSSHPGFHYSGTLKDNAADSDWVYTDGKVDGYGWAHTSAAENHDGYPNTISINQKVWGADPPGTGWIQVCRHRAGLIPNICTASGAKYSAG
jgi:hypothetical protein